MWETDKWGEGILSGSAIRECRTRGMITIDPFVESQVNSGSFDVRLGPQIVLYQSCVRYKNGYEPVSDKILKDENGTRLFPSEAIDSRYPVGLDTEKDDPVYTINRSLGDRFLLKPGIGYLMHTLERIGSTEFIPVLDGKSSIGRKFISIHQTAGFCDAGWEGQITLECTVLHPTWVCIGQRVGQVRFHTISGNKDRYKGRYKGALAVGAVPSRSWEQLQEQNELEVSSESV